MKVVSTTKAPAAIGPYSQAIIVNGILYTSGQIPINPKNGEIQGSEITQQAEQVMKNLGEVLKEAGSSFENAVKTTCFLADMADFAAFNDVYAKYFVGKPARSCVAVKTLPKDVLCEVEVIAVVQGVVNFPHPEGRPAWNVFTDAAVFKRTEWCNEKTAGICSEAFQAGCSSERRRRSSLVGRQKKLCETPLCYALYFDIIHT